MQEVVLSKTNELKNIPDFSKLIEFPGKRGFFSASLAVIKALQEEFPNKYEDWKGGANFDGEIPMLPELLATEQILKLNEVLSLTEVKNNIVRFEKV